MKFVVFAAAALFVAGPALAQGAGHASGAPAHDHAAAATTAPARTVQGVGVVKGVDATAGAITLHHAPIPAMKWPAMTMTFKATADVLKGVRTGQKVTFTLKPGGSSGEIVAIKAG